MPPLVSFVISRYGPVSIWAPRQLIGTAVSLMCLIGVAIDQMPRALARTLGAGLAVWVVLTVPASFPEHVRPPWRSLAQELAQEAQGRPVAAVEGWVALPLSYYSPRSVYLVSDPLVGSAREFVVVCRPARCESAALSGYSAVRSRRITWAGTDALLATLDVKLMRQPRSAPSSPSSGEESAAGPAHGQEPRP